MTSTALRSAGAKLAADVVIGAINALALAGLFWVGLKTWKAWGLWQARVAQIEVARQVGEDGINQPDPLLGFAHRPGAEVAMGGMGEGAVWRINGQGFRAEREYAPEVPEGWRRVIAVGDSFTFGNVAFEDTWPVQLERRLQATEVVNMGASGYGVDQMYLWYQRDGAALDADLVVLSIIAGDLLRALDRVWVSGHARPRFELVDGRLEHDAAPLPDRLPAGTPLSGPTTFPIFWATYLWRGIDGPPPPKDLEVPLRIVEEMARFVRALDRDFAVVLLPDRHDAQPELVAQLAERCARADVPFVDLTGAFEAAAPGGAWRDAPWFRVDEHYNPEGNRVVADALAAWLAGRGWALAPRPEE